MLLKEYLEGNDFEVITLADGNHALNLIEKESPDIVILDIMLPGKNGLEVLKEIRQKNSIPVVMLTAKGEDADRIVGLELGQTIICQSRLIQRATCAHEGGHEAHFSEKESEDDSENLVIAGALY
jgi:CheY-like chemotaxis protein